MKFLIHDEKVYDSFYLSRKSPLLLKYFFLSILFLILVAAQYLNLLLLPEISLPIQLDIRLFYTLLFVVLGLIFGFLGEVKRLASDQFLITNLRIIMKKGMMKTNIDAVSYDMITKVTTSQTFFQKLFGIGNVDISTSRGKEIVLNGVANPNDVKNAIYKAIESRRVRHAT